MIIHSSDLLGTAILEAEKAVEGMNKLRTSPMNGVEIFRVVESKLTEALAEVRLARWGLMRRNPAFDDRDSDLWLGEEYNAIDQAGRCASIPRYEIGT
jgi:hypothetical protein